ncbi:merozoite capping protein-1 [Lasiosphaeria hispida]|uniref:thioredoxin-dependent peroxiredoxin n=1 Tax=Lasiosphaeria hispida TaxID=260671 RepID=A0AAJ0HP65_9PEZI|nr:merozoite capping protein-1 [Lasiosphaeria hispida]
MPVELRKRKAPPPPPEPPAKKQAKVSKVAKAKEAVAKVKETVKPRGRPAKAAPAAAAVANGASAKPAANGKPEVGDLISLDGFGGEIETNDGIKTTLKALVEESRAGVVLFTYPKASTPGCTRQACAFRDSYTPLTAGGLAIYGLSTDSPKANTTFRDKQKLPYPLLCDPSAALIGAIGLKKAPKGTTRGVFVVDKAGKVLAAEAGGPEGTVSVVKKIVSELEEAGEEPLEKVEEKPAAEKPAEKAEEDEADVAEEDAPNGDAKAEEKDGEKKDE